MKNFIYTKNGWEFNFNFSEMILIQTFSIVESFSAIEKCKLKKENDKWHALLIEAVITSPGKEPEVNDCGNGWNLLSEDLQVEIENHCE